MMQTNKRQTHGRKILQEMILLGQTQDGSREQASADSALPVFNVAVDAIRDGVFSEQWSIESAPKLGGGRSRKTRH